MKKSLERDIALTDEYIKNTIKNSMVFFTTLEMEIQGEEERNLLDKLMKEVDNVIKTSKELSELQKDTLGRLF